jgi:hypothetical protein
LRKNTIEAKDAPQGGAKPLTRQARWRLLNPKAYWSHVALQSALRRGLVVRQPCEVCGEEKTDAHHHDYDRPLAVKWLCRRHHVLAHREAVNKRPAG